MFSHYPGVASHSPGFPVTPMLFSDFIPKVVNICTKKLGMRHNSIMPAKAFCSDGTQGYPTMLMTKHFGITPFDYGELGGIMDFARTSAYVTHGADLVIVHATHVGFDAATKTYGHYPRHRACAEGACGEIPVTANCGHVSAILSPYIRGWKSASTHTSVSRAAGGKGPFLLSFNDFFLEPIHKSTSLSSHDIMVRFDLDKMLKRVDGKPAELVRVSPVTRTFEASDDFSEHLLKYPRFAAAPDHDSSKNNMMSADAMPLGEALTQQWFRYECAKPPKSPYEENIREIMPYIVTHKQPMMAAAKGCIAAEFHRIMNELYFDKVKFAQRRMFYVTGVMIDVAPNSQELQNPGFFPRQCFAPWAAYVQTVRDGLQSNEIWDRKRVLKELAEMPVENVREMQLDDEMNKLRSLPPITFDSFHEGDE